VDGREVPQHFPGEVFEPLGRPANEDVGRLPVAGLNPIDQVMQLGGLE
jgi:hypothetical protein